MKTLYCAGCGAGLDASAGAAHYKRNGHRCPACAGDGSAPRYCPACGDPLGTDARGLYHDQACSMVAYRIRTAWSKSPPNAPSDPAPSSAELAAELRRQSELLERAVRALEALSRPPAPQPTHGGPKPLSGALKPLSGPLPPPGSDDIELEITDAKSDSSSARNLIQQLTDMQAGRGAWGNDRGEA